MRRTITVVAERFSRVDVFWDDRLPQSDVEPPEAGADVREWFVSGRGGGLLVSLIGAHGWGEEVEAAVGCAALVYVHASGIQGFVYGREVKRLNPECRVIFDYHDSLSFELYYQLRKRRLSWLYPAVWPAYRAAIRSLATAVDGVVGISERQVRELEATVGARFESATVPNVDEFDELQAEVKGIPVDMGVSYVWIGFVMAGRDLERVAAWVAGKPGMSELHVFGKVLDPEIRDEVEVALEERVSFHGAFQDTRELRDGLPGRSVGVFLGWDDPVDTGINKIASPNKYFTYIDLELPVIVDSRLQGLAAELDEWGAGEAVADPGEFAEASGRIARGYGSYRRGVRDLKRSYLEFSPQEPIRDLMGRVLDR